LDAVTSALKGKLPAGLCLSIIGTEGLPKSWFNDLVDRALRLYGKVYIIQPYREQEICARACQEAQGHECQCSCMGANHGIGNDGSWFEVSDTFSSRWGERELACRLLTAP
jgi:hypothetical protein